MNPTVIPPIPIIKDNEQRLDKIRRQLEDMFRSLHLIHDEIGVAPKPLVRKVSPRSPTY